MSFRIALAARSTTTTTTTATAKCPVPRPILNVLMMRREEAGETPLRSDDQYVADQMQSFRERYESVAGFPVAEAYLECILGLATSGNESPRVQEVMTAGVYDESYRRVLNVLESVGAFLEDVKNPDNGLVVYRRIAPKLIDQDFCWSMMDKISMKNNSNNQNTQNSPLTLVQQKDNKPKQEQQEQQQNNKPSKGNSPLGRLLGRNKKKNREEEEDVVDDNDEQVELGAVLLSAKEPTMTRQLNVLTNIVQRALLFGGDQEILVLSETLEADRPAFVQRWSFAVAGVDYLDCLIETLRICYRDGVAKSLEPPLPLTRGYANAYDRLMASLVEMGSGYVEAASSITAREELGRFAVWESSFRRSLSSYPDDLVGTYRVQDMIGGERIGAATTVRLEAQGNVGLDPPFRGLRWRLDAGPTHLDTCTFQVVSDDDGTVLQYRGFLDRGARIESRFSKRSIVIRGSVEFRMRNNNNNNENSENSDYWNDMIPINYRTGTSTTKFIMTKQSDS